MRRVRSLVTTAALAGALVLAAAGPAAADHLTSVDPTGCYIGAIATGGVTAVTTRSSIRERNDGVIRTVCRFRDLPETATDEDTGLVWVRPTTTYTSHQICQLTDDALLGAGNELFGTGIARFSPNGSVRVTCYFDLAEL